MVPTVAFPEGVPFTYQATDWLLFPVTEAENWVVSPARRVAFEGVIVMPLEVEPELDPPTPMPPPQPDHARIARERTTAPANLALKDFFVPIISDPLS